MTFESFTRWLISAANFLEDCSCWMSFSSMRISAISPVPERLSRIESSIFMSERWSSAFFFTISVFFYCNDGSSSATIYASIYSSRPPGVIAKLIILTFTNVSGG